jgi:hypothetical protein
MCVDFVIALRSDARIGCAFGGRDGMVYTVGDSRKFALVGLASAVFGCRYDAPKCCVEGDSG